MRTAHPKLRGTIMKRSPEITTLFLDIGGVLLTDGWGHDYRTLAAMAFGLNPKDLENRQESQHR